MRLRFIDPEWAERRVRMTLSCRDSDRLPKVGDAGTVVERDGSQVQVMHNGVIVQAGCYYGHWKTEVIRGLQGHHEPQEEVAFAEVLEMLKESGGSRRPLIVELGSFWAYYSLWFLNDFPEGRAVCLEPDPRYLEIGRENFALNGREGVFVHGVVGDGSGGGMVPFVPESDLFAVDPPLGEIQLRPYSLLEVAELGGSDHIDVLVVDIQGAEEHLVESELANLSQGLVRYAVISTHHHSISGSALTHQRVLERVEAAGGEVLAEHSVPESYSGDGLVVASFVPSDARRPIAVSRARAKESLFGEVEHDCEAFRVGELRALQERELLEQQHKQTAADLVAAEVRMELLSEMLRHARRRDEIDALLSSRSWRVTAPLRRLAGRG